jgi:hypothetical protein
LETDRIFRAVAHQQAQRCRQPAAGTRAADRDARRINPERTGLAMHPGEGGIAILDRGGRSRFRRQAIVGRDDHAAKLMGGTDVARLIGDGEAGDIAAAMDIEQRGQRAGGIAPRTVDQNGHVRRTRRPRDAALLDGNIGMGEAGARRQQEIVDHRAAAGEVGLELEHRHLLDACQQLRIDRSARLHPTLSS